MLDKWTSVDETGRYFNLNYEKLEPVTIYITAAINEYMNNTTSGLKGNAPYFTVKDVAKRVLAGTGSLGTPRYYVLIEGETISDKDDRILDVKQQGFPSVYPYLNTVDINRINQFTPGCRVAKAQKAMLTDVDDQFIA